MPYLLINKNKNCNKMSGISGRQVANPYEIRRYNASNKDVIAKMADYRTIWERYPQAKDYTMLEPAVRRIADWTREGMLTKGGSLLSIFEDQARVVYESGNNMRHRLYIEDNDLRATVMKVDYEIGEKLGKGRTEFSIWLDVEWFSERDLLLLDSAQEAPLLIKSVSPDGNLWEYRVQLTEDGYINANEIVVGDMVTQIGSARGEAADQRGSVHIGKDNSYIEFSTPKTSMGWEFTVTDDAWKSMQQKNQFYALIPQNADERKRDPMITTNLLDMKFMAATDRQIDLWLTYGKGAGKFSGAYLDSLTSKHYKLGPGFYEWMKYSKIDYFNPASFSIEYLANIMTQRWHNNVDPKDRVVDFGTGSLGLKWFADACKRYGIKSSLEDFEVNNEISGNGFDGMHTGVIVNKKQYVGAFLPEFGKIKVHYLPHLDDDKFEKRRYRGYSIRSGEFIALNTGFGNGADSNIYIVKDPEENGFGYGVGLWSPYGATFKNKELVNRWVATEGTKNQYKLIRDESFTVVVKDPAAIMWLKPAIK